jgi:vitamin B12 transporter
MTRLAPRARVLVACAALSLVPAGLRAQDPRDTVRLREIVVTATRLPTPREDVASAVTVLDGATLRARGVTRVLDALRETPGIAVVQSGTSGAVASLFMRGGESDYVRVLVDGVPVNQPGGAVNLADLSLDNVDRIEVVRGPASVLYGSDAVAGVVQIFTRRGGGAASLRSVVRVGSYGTRLGEVSLEGGRGPLGVSAGVSRLTAGGVYPVNSGYESWTASALARLVAGTRGEAQLSMRHQDGWYRFPTDFTGFPSDSNQFTAGRATTVSLEAGRRVSSRVEVRFLAGWHQEDDRAENAPDSPAEADGFTNRTRFRRLGADARVNLRAAARVTLTVGAALEEEAFRNAIAFTGGFPAADTLAVSRTDRAAYAQLVAGLGQRVTLTAGSRFDDNEAFGGYATWRAGLVVRAVSGTRLRAGAGTSFKEPTFFENFGGGFATGNRGLDPERSRSFDLGVERSLAGGRASIGATYFDQRFRDLIQYTFAVASGTPNYRNVAGAGSRGLELEARAFPARGTAVAVRYTYLHTVVADSGVDGSTFAVGRPLLRRPAHSGSLSVDGRLAARASGGASVLVVGEREDLDFRNADPVTFAPRRAVLPAYARVDIGGEIDLAPRAGARPGLALTLRVENLFAARYAEVLYYPARGRTVLLGVRATSGR